MMPAQLKETTMDPAKRTLLRVVLLAEDREDTADLVERLMGTKAEARFAFISDKAEFASDDLFEFSPGNCLLGDGIMPKCGSTKAVRRNR